MDRLEGPITFDMGSFQVCQTCLRFVAILLMELYVLFLYARQMINL
jgi:hypothetical protein